MEASWQNLIADWDIPVAITCTLATSGAIYVRAWIALHRSRPAILPVWHLVSFSSGILAIFIAVSSPLDTFSDTLLFMRMAQHFVLISVAPPLIVLGCPLVPMLRGLPRWIVQCLAGPLLRSSSVHRFSRSVSRLPVTWLAMNLTYVGWHVPRAYELALSSEEWHNFEHLLLCVLVADRAAVVHSPVVRRMDAHAIFTDLGFGEHRVISVSVFLRSFALSKLCPWDASLWHRRTPRSGCVRSVHVGMRFPRLRRSANILDRSHVDGNPPDRNKGEL